MINPDDWEARTVQIKFVNETDGDDMRIREFDRIRKDATPSQLWQFGKSVSQLTPNGSGDLVIGVIDSFALEPED